MKQDVQPRHRSRITFRSTCNYLKLLWLSRFFEPQAGSLTPIYTRDRVEDDLSNIDHRHRVTVSIYMCIRNNNMTWIRCLMI